MSEPLFSDRMLEGLNQIEVPRSEVLEVIGSLKDSKSLTLDDIHPRD